jgi:hypothetical protein
VACLLRRRQTVSRARSETDRSAVTPQSDTCKHDEIARPSRRVEGIRPAQNPADDPFDGVKPGAFYLVVLLYLT